MPEKREKLVALECAECGSRDLGIEAFCSWDVHEQRIDAHEMCDEGHTCENCGGPCQIVEVEFDSIETVLDNIDWDLLHIQKLELVAMIVRGLPRKEDNAVMSVVRLLDRIQDYADGMNMWRFPKGEEE